MSEPVIEERWVQCSARTMDRRLDALRLRADYLRERIDRSPSGSRPRDEQERAALMWALAELSGIGDDIRRERAEQEHRTVAQYRKATARAETAEALNAQYRVTVAALKAELYRQRTQITQCSR